MKTSSKFISCCILLSFLDGGPSDTVEHGYDSEAIYLTYSFFTGAKYVKNGQEHSTGILYMKLMQEMSAVPEAQAKAREGVKSIVYGIMSPVVTVPMIALTAMRSDPRRFLSIVSGGFITSQMISSHFTEKGKADINEAVWLYNRAVTSQSYNQSDDEKFVNHISVQSLR